MTTLYDEMYDAYLGEGNHERFTFGDWLDDTAENPDSVLQDAARKLRRQLCNVTPDLITACEHMAFQFDEITVQQSYVAALGYFCMAKRELRKALAEITGKSILDSLSEPGAKNG